MMAVRQAPSPWADVLFAQWDAATSQPGRRTTPHGPRRAEDDAAHSPSDHDGELCETSDDEGESRHGRARDYFEIERAAVIDSELTMTP